jgi:hypothetical protein
VQTTTQIQVSWHAKQNSEAPEHNTRWTPPAHFLSDSASLYRPRSKTTGNLVMAMFCLGHGHKVCIKPNGSTNLGRSYELQYRISPNPEHSSRSKRSILIPIRFHEGIAGQAPRRPVRVSLISLTRGETKVGRTDMRNPNIT